MARGLGSLPFTWGVHMEFLAPCFSLVQPWLLWALGSKLVDEGFLFFSLSVSVSVCLSVSPSLYVSLLFCHSAFEINK